MTTLDKNFTDDDWLTPPGIIQALGQFDLDPCAPASRPWDMANRHFSKIDDGLVQPWTGRIWLNPPYSKIGGKSQVERWTARIAAHGSGCALVNTRTETKWFFESVWSHAHAVYFFKTRLKFFRPDGTIGADTGTNASVLAAFSAADARAMLNLREKYQGKFIPLIIQFAPEVRTTWRQLVRWLMQQCGGQATLEQLYEAAAGHPKLASNKHWQAKIRQTVQDTADRVAPALWRQRLLSV